MIKETVSDFREFRAWMNDWFFLRRMSVKMSLAIRLADIKQKAFNKRYHIMLLCLPKGEKLVSVSSNDILSLKRKKMLPKDANVFTLTHGDSIFYSTPLNRNNRSSAEERRNAKKKYLKYAKRLMK